MQIAPQPTDRGVSDPNDLDDTEPEPDDLLPIHDSRPTKKKPGKTFTAKEGPERDAHFAKATITSWADTVGRFLSQSPSVDDYLKQFPGKQADAALDAVKACYEALKAWAGRIK